MFRSCYLLFIEKYMPSFCGAALNVRGLIVNKFVLVGIASDKESVFFIISYCICYYWTLFYNSGPWVIG